MPNQNLAVPQNNYDPRWFIWTIVFLVVTGISLVSYIVLSDNGTNDISPITVAHADVHKAAAAK
jgi:hypothetical protein